MKAYIVRERLSDGSEAYNVRLEEDGRTEDLDCIDQESAQRLIGALLAETVNVEAVDTGNQLQRLSGRSSGSVRGGIERGK